MANKSSAPLNPKGQILAVTVGPRGDELLVAHASGVTTLYLEDVSDFDDAGGIAVIDKVQRTYTAVDRELNTLTLASPLPAALPEGEKVFAFPYVSEKTGMVEVSSVEDVVLARVPHSLYDRLAEGIRDPGEQEFVILEMVDGDWAIKDVLSVIPEIDGGYIDPGTAPFTLKDEMDSTIAEIEGDFADVYTAIANGDSANATAISNAVTDFNNGLATKSKYFPPSTSAPGSTPNNAGDVWERVDGTGKVIGRWRGAGGTSWTAMNLAAAFIPALDIGTGTFGDLSGSRIQVRSLGVDKLIVSDLTNRVRPLTEWPGYFVDGSGGVFVVTGNGTGNTHFQPSGGSNQFAVEPGDKYRFAWKAYMNYAGFSGVAQGYIMFYSGETFLSAVGVAPISQGKNDYNTVEGTFTVPTGATKAVFYPYVSANGQIAVRAMSIYRMNGGELIIDGTIAGRHLTADSITGLLVTGAAIQTQDDGAPPWAWARGVKISSSGIAGYPSAGASAATFAFSTSTGRAHLTGGISTGTGYDDITITPGTNLTPSAMEFWTNGPYYDNATGNRAGLLCFDYTRGSYDEVIVRLHGPKMYTKGTRPRIDMITRRHQTTGDVEADVLYHAGADPSGDSKGAHWFYIDGDWKGAVGTAGLTMASGTAIGIGVSSWLAPNTGLYALGSLKTGGRIDVDAGFYDQSVAIGTNGSWKNTTASWNSSGRIVGNVSSERFKENIRPLPLEVARRALDLEAVIFNYKPEMERGSDDHPGFLAEKAHEAGLSLWVNYDEKNRPTSILYQEFTAAHNVILRDVVRRLEALETKNA